MVGASPAASPATRSARTGTTGQGRPDADRRQPATAAILRTLDNPTPPMPSFAGLPAGEEDGARRLPRAAATASSLARPLMPSPAGPHGHPGGGAGARDVRPHRGRLRPHELGDDGRAAPPLARARGRPRRSSARATARSTSPPAPATWRSSSRGAWRPAGGRRARTSPRRCSTRARREGAGDHVGVGATRSRCPTPDDELRRRDRRLRRAQLLRPRSRAARDGARGAAGRPGRRARDHDADEAAALDLLPALVRPRRARARQLAGDPDAYTYLPELGQALPGARGARRRAWPRAGLTDVRWILTAGGIIAHPRREVP